MFTTLEVVELSTSFLPFGRSYKLSISPISKDIISFEDPRAFVWRGELYLMHNQSCFVDGIWSTSIVFGRISDSWAVIDQHVPPMGKNLNRAASEYAKPAFEKNWTPVVVHDDLYAIYELNPLTVFKFNGLGWDTVGVLQREWDSPYSSYLSGSTPLIQWRNSNQIGLFHTYEKLGKRRLYSAGFFVVDTEKWKIAAISPKPILTGWKDRWLDTRNGVRGFLENAPTYLVVFPAGIMDCGKDWVVSYGWNDCRNYVTRFNKNDTESTLLPVD